MADDWTPSALYTFTSDLGVYIFHLRCITGDIVEPGPQGVDLPSEYRWEIGQSTEQLLGEAEDRLTAEVADAIRAFAAEVERLPRSAPSLSDERWGSAQTMARDILATIRPIYEDLEPMLVKDS